MVGAGEPILSCRSSRDPKRTPSRNKGKSLDALDGAPSGACMSSPHISGLLAAFLSVRTAFIGYPDRVERNLLEHCTDLNRDRDHQGAGLQNLSKIFWRLEGFMGP